jgi:hypothetical protein
LAEDKEHDNKAALPVGVANLSIYGNQFQNGETCVMDLPILSLKQARPVAPNRNGLGGFQALSPSSMRRRISQQAILLGLRRRRRRMVSKDCLEEMILERKIPSVAEKNFTAAGTSELILHHIELQVIEKGVGREFLGNIDLLAKNLIAPGITNNSTPKLEDKSESDAARSLKSPLGMA